MSMISITGGSPSVGRAGERRGPGLFARLGATLRVAAALRDNVEPSAADLEVLGLTEAFRPFLEDRRARRAA